MKLRVGTALFGLGVLFLVIAVGVPLYVAPAVTKLPYDLPKTTSTAQANNARFLQIAVVDGSVKIDIPQATLESTVEVIPNAKDTVDRLPKKLRGEAVIWDVYQTVKRTDRDEMISQYSTQLALYRVSGEAAPWKEQWLNEDGAEKTPTGNVTYSGQVYKFPFDTQKMNYRVFDRDLKRSLPAKYIGTETIDGIEVYRFEQRIVDEPLATPEESLTTLLGRFAPEATSGRLLYSNTRTLWVEPMTGTYIKVREQQRKVLVPDNGTETILLDADFNSTKESISNSLKTVRENRFKLNLIGVYLPFAAAVLGLAALVVGLLMVLRHNTAAAAAPPRRDDDDTLEMSHSGPLTDELPSATHNWRTDDPTVPNPRQAPGEVEQR
ncbi:MAG TPA: DUF3068 domain-containing protein [Micromonosporaceae bacterium]|nr:DUF3068 domain-containing protein [Micromonosporaceae bacterium]